jgi:hypothetical protein
MFYEVSEVFVTQKSASWSIAQRRHTGLAVSRSGQRYTSYESLACLQGGDFGHLNGHRMIMQLSTDPELMKSSPNYLLEHVF